MTRNRTQPEIEPAVDATAAEPAGRRPYRAPKLRHLGSVRELTLGSTGVWADGGITRQMTKNM